jgi:hypothetical protein
MRVHIQLVDVIAMPWPEDKYGICSTPGVMKGAEKWDGEDPKRRKRWWQQLHFHGSTKCPECPEDRYLHKLGHREPIQVLDSSYGVFAVFLSSICLMPRKASVPFTVREETVRYLIQTKFM